MAERVPMNLQKKAGKCTSMETEAASKTNNELINAGVKAHLRKCQLEDGKHASVRQLSTTIDTV